MGWLVVEFEWLWEPWVEVQKVVHEGVPQQKMKMT